MNRDKYPKLNLIVACDLSNGIGKCNTLPWSIKEDMNYFKNTTIGNGHNCVIMGKNTYESIPEKYFPLINRDNYIISSTLNNTTTNNITYKNIESLLIKIFQKNYDTIWIIGGTMLYSYILSNMRDKINEIHLTRINKHYNCDKFFPDISNNFIVKKRQILKEGVVVEVYISK